MVVINFLHKSVKVIFRSKVSHSAAVLADIVEQVGLQGKCIIYALADVRSFGEVVAGVTLAFKSLRRLVYQFEHLDRAEGANSLDDPAAT